MDEEDKESYQEILQKNLYLFSRYIAAEDFLEKLISEDVLTIDDKEIITNKCIHHNRRERANKLIEILMTRGDRGYEKFLEILEYQYPHVYQDVTQKEPRDPPIGFQRNRMSDRLRIIRNLPNLLEQMKAQVMENSDLGSELCVLQQLLEVSKEENTALEREVENLKNIRQENKQLMLKLKQLETDNYEQQVTINTWTTKAYHLMETQSEYKDKCNDLQVKYDKLYKEFTETKGLNSTDTVQGPRIVPEGPKSSPPHVDNGPHYRARLDILEQELENNKMECDDMAARLQKANDYIKTLEEDKDRLSKEARKYFKEKENLESQLVSIRIQKDSNYLTAKKNAEQLIEEQERGRAMQGRLTELEREKNELFDHNHRLETELSTSKAELDRIKARLSGSSLEPASSGSDTEKFDPEELPKVNRTIQDIDGFDIGLQCLSIHQRRNVVKKRTSEDGGSEHRQKLDVLGDSVMEMAQKANTLPVKANESPERMFQREVAYFRYTHKQKGPSISDSMVVHKGSVHEKISMVDTEALPFQIGPENGLFYNRAVSVENCADSRDDVPDNASGSTVYIPRSPRPQLPLPQQQQQQQQTPQISEKDRKNSLLPTGGKVYKRDNIDRQHSTDRAARCESILSRSDSIRDGNVTSDFSSHEVYTALLPKDCLIVNKSGWTQNSMSRCLTVKFSALGNSSDFKGGNHTGIFLTRPLHGMQGLDAGNQIKAIIFTPEERRNPLKTDLKGCTLEDFYRLLSGDFINKKKEKEICLEVRNSKDEYDSACKWMESNNGHGDYFYIRCNVNLDKKRDESISLKTGDIFLVKNSCYREEQWQGHMIDASTGHILNEKLCLIPNIQQANIQRLAFGRSTSTEDEESLKRGGRRVKGQAYERVLPMKASTKLPVYIIGPGDGLELAMLDLISSNLSSECIVDPRSSERGYLDGSDGELELYRREKHIVRVGKLENIKSCQSVHRLTVFMNITEQLSTAETKKLFDKDDLQVTDTTLSQCESIKQKLIEAGIRYEETVISSVSTKESLLRSFKTSLKTSQNRILWLNSSEMDEQVAERYPTYLGQLCDLSHIQADLQERLKHENHCQTNHYQT